MAAVKSPRAVDTTVTTVDPAVQDMLASLKKCGLPADPCQCCGWHIHADANGGVKPGATGIAYVVGSLDDDRWVVPDAAYDRWIMCETCWRLGYQRGETRVRMAPVVPPTPRRDARSQYRSDAARQVHVNRTLWTWTCLCCDVTGIGDSSAHECAMSERWHALRAYWIRRFQWARPDQTIEAIGPIVEQPIERTDLASWLGESWLPAGDL